MNKIVGRVADRSACNRKENRIKRALNGAIIHGNRGWGYAEERAKWTSWGGNGGTVEHEDVSGHSFRGRLTRARNYDGQSFLVLPLSLSFAPSLFLWTLHGVSLSCRARKNAAGLRNSIWPFDAHVCKCERCGVMRERRYINCARQEMTGESRDL